MQFQVLKTPARADKFRGGEIKAGSYVHQGISLLILEGDLLGEGTEGNVYNASFESPGSPALALKSPKKGHFLNLELGIEKKLTTYSGIGKTNLSIPINSRSTSGTILLEKANGDLFGILIKSKKLNLFLTGSSDDTLKKGFI